MTTFRQFTYIFLILSLFFTINCIPILEIPIQYLGNKMFIYFQNYSNPVALSFSHAYSYLSSSYFTERYQNIESYPPSLGTNEFFSEYKLFYDEFNFKESQTPFKMYFYAINEKSEGNLVEHFRDYITFRYNQTRNNNSIVIQMYKQQIIEHPQFGISHLNKKLFFGGIPNQNKLKQILYQQLNSTLLNQLGWYTDFSYLTIGNKKFDYINNNYKALFDLGGTELSKTILIPNETMNYIKKEYFVPQNKTQNCYSKTLTFSQVSHYYEVGERYFCKPEITKQFPQFVFGFNNQKIIFQGEEFFNCEQKITTDNYCLFEMHERDGHSLAFTLGITFFKRLVVLFDYNIPKVELFKELGCESIKYSNMGQIQKTILMINIILLVFMVIFIIGLNLNKTYLFTIKL